MEARDNLSVKAEKAYALLDGATCIVQVFNDLPPQYGIKIGGGNCAFYYQDANGNLSSSYTEFHPGIDIESGKILFFQSDRPHECVQYVQVNLKGQAPDGTTKDLVITGPKKPANQCWTVKEFHVGIPQSMDFASIKKHVTENLTLFEKA